MMMMFQSTPRAAGQKIRQAITYSTEGLLNIQHTAGERKNGNNISKRMFAEVAPPLSLESFI